MHYRPWFLWKWLLFRPTIGGNTLYLLIDNWLSLCIHHISAIRIFDNLHQPGNSLIRWPRLSIIRNRVAQVIGANGGSTHYQIWLIVQLYIHCCYILCYQMFLVDYWSCLVDENPIHIDFLCVCCISIDTLYSHMWTSNANSNSWMWTVVAWFWFNAPSHFF